jgi:hypothetical protein
MVLLFADKKPRLYGLSFLIFTLQKCVYDVAQAIGQKSALSAIFEAFFEAQKFTV